MPTYGENNFKESNVNYLNKDFSALKQSLMDYAKSYFPNTYRDFNETSPGMMLLEMNAYVGDVLSFYIDQQYREMLLPLAEERRNIINLSKMFGYKVKPIVPSYVDLTFTQELSAMSDDVSKVDYKTGGIFNKGIQVIGTTSTQVFETLDVLDFQISSSVDNTDIATLDSEGLANTYRVNRTVRAVSGKEKTATFTIGAPEKFKKITLSDKNVIDIISCIDSNGSEWYEVDFLAQDNVPISTHYTEDVARQSAYHTSLSSEVDSFVPVPYSLQYVKTSKRFVRETNVDNTTSLIFGNGVLKNGEVLESGFIDLEQVGIVIPGQSNDLNESIDPLLGDEYSTLGETPNNTTLTITYRVGGGIDSNLPSGDLTIIQNGSTMNGSADGVSISNLVVVNDTPARGGRDEETTDEIRQKAQAFFSTQNRCVTKEDYEARVLNLPSRFGSIAKVYVARSGVETQEGYNQAQLDIGNSLTILNNLTDGMTTQSEAINTIIQDMINGVVGTGQGLDLIEANNSANLQQLSQIPSNIQTLQQLTQLDVELASVNIFVLSYDNTKNLVGNPAASYNSNFSDNVPLPLLQNIKNYLSNFRILTDTIKLFDGFIINFGVFFDVIAEKYADKQKVKFRCIDKIKEYFEIEKMQFNQPIYLSQLEFELMGIEGVRSVGHITITQEIDYNDGTDNPSLLPTPTYTYSHSNDVDTNGDGIAEGGFTEDSSGETGYGYLYNFENALENGIIRPPELSTPAVFELKNPNQNIQGRVR